MKFTDTQITIDNISKIPTEAAGAQKGYTTPDAIGVAMSDGTLTIAKTSGLQDTLDTLQDNIDAIPPLISAVAGDVTTLDGRIDGNDSAITTLDGRIDGHDSDISTLDSRVDGHDQDIIDTNALFAGKANLEGGNTLTGTQAMDNASLHHLDYNLDGKPAHSEGRVFYDTVDKSLAYYNDEAAVTMNIGREVWVRVKNMTAAPLTDGQVVFISGANEEHPTVQLALADAITTARVLGVITHTIPIGQFGYVTTGGIVNGLNLAIYPDGTPLYLSSTVPGTLTSTYPVAPNAIIRVGIVAFSHPSRGKLYVHPETYSLPSAGILDGTHLATPSTAVVRSVTGGANFVELGATGDITLAKTITPSGTTGNRTINTNLGSVNFAATATSLTVVNNKVTPNSLIFISKATNDNTARLGGVVAAQGQFVIYMDSNGPGGGECKVNFLVIN